MRKEITERAYRLALRLTKLRSDRNYREMVEREVLRQVFKAGSSVAANLEEANGAQTKADFVAKISIAKKESFELQFWLRLASDAELLPNEIGKPMRDEASSIGRVVSTIVRQAKSSESRLPPVDCGLAD